MKTRKIKATDLDKTVPLQVRNLDGTWVAGGYFLVTQVRRGGISGYFVGEAHLSAFNRDDVLVVKSVN